MIAAIALGRRYHARLFINDYWRLAVKHRRTACIWDRKIWKRPISTRSVTSVCGWAFLPMMIWRSTWRWRPAPLTSRSVTFSRRKPNRCRPLHRGLTQLAAHVKRLADYPTVAIGGISLERAPAVLETGVGSIAVVSAITRAADWQAATARLLQLAGAGDERS